MCLLWNRREVIDAERLSLGDAAWAALTSADPRALAAIARTRTPALPHLGLAVHRHLQELPSLMNGLSMGRAHPAVYERCVLDPEFLLTS